MSWALYRWTWQVKSPLYMGIPPAGVLTRCCLYVPARTLWGAITHELGKREIELPSGNPFNPSNVKAYYQKLGDHLKDKTRLSYLYPAELIHGKWQTWLPRYQIGQGLSWLREDQTDKEAIAHRAFRSRLLYTRLSTAIQRATGTADDETLHETECVQPFWRRQHPFQPVAMVGYLFIRQDSLLKEIEKLEQLFVGGDSRYGLGHLTLESKLEQSEQLFNLTTDLNQEKIKISVKARQTILGHTLQTTAAFLGALEAIGRWDMHQKNQPSNHLYWSPGAQAETEQELTIHCDGKWGKLN